MNKILGQYFLKELAVTWFSVTFFLLVVLATNKFADVIISNLNIDLKQKQKLLYAIHSTNKAEP